MSQIKSIHGRILTDVVLQLSEEQARMLVHALEVAVTDLRDADGECDRDADFVENVIEEITHQMNDVEGE